MMGSFALADSHTQKAKILEGLNKTAGSADISQIENDDATTGLTTLLGITINYLFGAVAIVFLTIILVGGYIWMTAQGQQEQIDRAKKFVLNGVFGMMVIFLSYTLVTVVIFFLNRATVPE